MQNRLFDLTKEFVSIHAAPGREHKLADYVVDMAKPLCDECYIDRVGNVICKIEGIGVNKKKILFSAHMDEVAMMVTYIDDNGYIRFTSNGGPGYISAAYTDIVFENGTRGVLTLDTAGSFDTKTMVIDIGAKTKEEAEKCVKVGDSISVESQVMHLCGSRIAGRPIDNRLGMAILMEAMTTIHNSNNKPYNDSYFAFSVQEETAVPPVGAAVLGHEIQPDIGIAVDGCGTSDTYGAIPINAFLGCGAAITAREPTLVVDKALLDTMVRVAKRNNIPHNVYVDIHGGTDAVAFQKIGKGCMAGIISYPMRYLHTRVETVDLYDAEASTRLVSALCYEENFERDK